MTKPHHAETQQSEQRKAGLTAAGEQLEGSEERRVPRGGNETILVVDDEPTVRMLTRMVLERAGYRVIEAASGADGWREFEKCEGRIDLVFTDVVMPDGMSGRELADKLLTIQPGLRVLFTSGYSVDFAGRELLLTDGQLFLQKPATPKEILDTVRRALDR